MRLLRVLVLMGGILHSIAQAEPSNDSSSQSQYFPLALGNEWVYSMYGSLMDTVLRYDTVRVDDIANYRGATFFHISTPWFPLSSFWVRTDDDGDMYWCETPGSSENPYLLKSQGGWVLGTGACVDSVRRVSCSGPIVTPAGSFDDLFCVSSSKRENDCYDLFYSTVYAREVGPIVFRMEGIPGAYFEWTLVEAHFATPISCKCHGDPICDGVRDVRDVVSVIDIAFRGTPPLLDRGCSWYARSILGPSDVDCSGRVDIIDVISIIDVALRGADAGMKFCHPNMP